MTGVYIGLAIYVVIGLPVFLCWWGRGRGPRENNSRSLARYLAERDPHQSTDGDRFAVPPFHVDRS